MICQTRQLGNKRVTIPDQINGNQNSDDDHYIVVPSEALENPPNIEYHVVVSLAPIHRQDEAGGVLRG